MSIAACAQLVQRGDPDRCLAVMSAPLAAREKLFVLLAFNLEVARAPWVTQEAMIAEMRLQWWLDTIDQIYAGQKPRAHEVVAPLAELIMAHDLPRAPFDALINARRWDIYAQPHIDLAAQRGYLRETAGNLMLLGAYALGAGSADHDTIMDYGQGVGCANYLLAVPSLLNAQKQPLIDSNHSAIANMAKESLAQMTAARHQIGPRVRYGAALRMGWAARSVLKRAVHQPMRVFNDTLRPAEFWTKTRLLYTALRATY